MTLRLYPTHEWCGLYAHYCKVWQAPAVSEGWRAEMEAKDG